MAATSPVFTDRNRRCPVGAEEGGCRVDDRGKAAARVRRHLTDERDLAAAWLRQLGATPHTVHANAWDRRETGKNAVNRGRSRPNHREVVHRTATDSLEDYYRENVSTRHPQRPGNLPE
jgi:hypothetical protein